MLLKEKRESEDPKSSKYYFVPKESISFSLFIGCEVTMKKHTEEDEVYLHHLCLALLSYSFVFIQGDVAFVCGLWCLLNRMLLWLKR